LVFVKFSIFSASRKQADPKLSPNTVIIIIFRRNKRDLIYLFNKYPLSMLNTIKLSTLVTT
jgi:hypothetical protein